VESENRKVLYLTALKKINGGLCAALKTARPRVGIKEALRGIDVWSSTDLQFLQGKSTDELEIVHGTAVETP